MSLQRIINSAVRNTHTINVISKRSKVTLPNLPYDYKDLEPIISRDIMTLHHQKHHAAYVNNFNVAEEKLKEAVAKGDTKTIIELGPGLKFNGGGHLNHCIFWEVLSPSSSAGKPSSQLESAINQSFGSFDSFKQQLSTLAVGVQGSGWAWLGYNPKSKGLALATCANQDPLQATAGLVPLFGIDVWEHAYYLQYKNVRPDYVKAIFEIANWQNVSKRFEEASK